MLDADLATAVVRYEATIHIALINDWVLRP